MTDADWRAGSAKSVAVFLNGDAISEPDWRAAVRRDVPGFAPAWGGRITLSWRAERSLPMVKAGEGVLGCACPGCVNEPRLGKAGAAERGYCGLPDPVAGEPYLALTGSGGAG